VSDHDKFAFQLRVLGQLLKNSSLRLGVLPKHVQKHLLEPGVFRDLPE
jgi:hypothetical protein